MHSCWSPPLDLGSCPRALPVAPHSGKIRALVKCGTLDPIGIIPDPTCFEGTTWLRPGVQSPSVPLLIFACFNGVPAPVIDLLLKLGANVNCVTDCGLPAPLAGLCAKVSSEEHKALFQVTPASPASARPRQTVGRPQRPKSPTHASRSIRVTPT